MKKILALVLAVVMTMGLASVAFAAVNTTITEAELYVSSTAEEYNLVDKDGDAVNDDDGDPIKYKVKASGLYTWDGDNSIFKLETINGDSYDLTPTTKVAIPLEGDKKDDKTTVNKYKAFFEAKVGKVENIAIEYVKVKGAVGSNYTADTYVYAVTFEVPDTTTAKYDLAGELTVAKTTSAAKNLRADRIFVYNLKATAAYKELDINGGESDVNSDTKKYVLNFSKVDGEVDIEFGNDLALFVVNGSGQSKVNAKYNTKYNSSIGAKYDYANLDFITFEKSPVFNRNGELYIYADEDTYLYSVNSNGDLVETNAVYDDAYGAWKLTTRTLGSFVISDRELRLEATASSSEAPADEDESSSTTAPADEDTSSKPNPNTGR